MTKQPSIDAILEDLYHKGVDNDQRASNTREMMLNITPDTGEFLASVVDSEQPRRILEIGTSNAYSTIWIGRAAKSIGVSVDTVDHNPSKIRMAAANLSEAGLQKTVTIHMRDAGSFLAEQADDRYDFVFLDSDRKRYAEWADDLLRVLDFGILIVDNATSHPEEMDDFRGAGG